MYHTFLVSDNSPDSSTFLLESGSSITYKHTR